MKETTLDMIKKISEADISYALLDEENRGVRILLEESDKQKFLKLAKTNGWKKLRDKSGDLYLYGIERFWYYQMEEIRLTVCFRLACRSTLNSGWVPLDRKINSGALNRTVSDGSNSKIRRLEPTDELCYLLAKCVYTDHIFQQCDRERIQKCLIQVKEPEVSDKLAGIFFHFTPVLLDMLQKKEYEDIERALWQYADY